MSTLAVADTHTLIWAATGQRRLLGKHARKLLDRVERGAAAIYVPTICLIEIGEASQRGAITFSGGFERWVTGLLSSGRYHAVELTVPIVLRAQQLYAIPERGDRIIAATAAEMDVPLVTRDVEIAGAAAVEIIW